MENVIAHFGNSAGRPLTPQPFSACISVFPDKTKSGETWRCEVVRIVQDVAYVLPIDRIPAPTERYIRSVRRWLAQNGSRAAFIAALGYRGGVDPAGKEAKLLPSQMSRLDAPPGVEAVVKYTKNLMVEVSRQGVTVTLPCVVTALPAGYDPVFGVSQNAEYRRILPYRPEKIRGTVATVMWHGREVFADLEQFLNFDAAKIEAVIDKEKASKMTTFARLSRTAEGEVIVDGKPYRIAKSLYDLATAVRRKGKIVVRLKVQPATKSETKAFRDFVSRLKEFGSVAIAPNPGFEQFVEAWFGR